MKSIPLLIRKLSTLERRPYVPISYELARVVQFEQVPISGHLAREEAGRGSAHGVPGDGFDRESLSQAHTTGHPPCPSADSRPGKLIGSRSTI